MAQSCLKKNNNGLLRTERKADISKLGSVEGHSSNAISIQIEKCVFLMSAGD